MTPARWAYLALTLAGLVSPLRHSILWFQEAEGSYLDFIRAMLVNHATIGLATTVLIVNVAVVIFVLVESRARHDRLGLVAVPATLLFGPAVGLPFYLFLRLRTLE